MKKRTIIALIIAGVFLVSGIICCGAAAGMVDFDFARLGTNASYEQRQYEVSAADVEAIFVDDRNNGIMILPSQDDKIRITYYENEKEGYRIEEKDGSLSIEYRDTRKWYEYIGISWSDMSRDMTIELPAGYSGTLKAETANGAISVSDVSAGELTVASSNGRITLENTVADEIHVKTSNGKIVTEEVGAKGKISLQTSNGAIVLGITEVGAGLTCKTSNGAIKGSVPGDLSDYSVTAQTSNGESNLPERYDGGEKTLQISTSNGAIQVEFR